MGVGEPPRQKIRHVDHLTRQALADRPLGPFGGRRHIVDARHRLARHSLERVAEGVVKCRGFRDVGAHLDKARAQLRGEVG